MFVLSPDLSRTARLHLHGEQRCVEAEARPHGDLREAITAAAIAAVKETAAVAETVASHREDVKSNAFANGELRRREKGDGFGRRPDL